MPHLVILYTPNLEPLIEMTALCQALAKTMNSLDDETGKKVFPTGGIRVLAYPAAHYAVADTSGDFGFMYLNVRMGRGRSSQTHQAVGQQLVTAAKAFVDPIMPHQIIGMTLQIDEANEVFDHKHSNLHPLFA
jgi:5-carboxymethyl-2-hydroxymuconate isomerase